MKRDVILNHNRRNVLWMIDLAKLLAVVSGATLLGLLFEKSGFPETTMAAALVFGGIVVAVVLAIFVLALFAFPGQR